MESARQIIRVAGDPRVALGEVIARCAAEVDDPAWEAIAAIDFEGAWQRDERWFDDLIAAEPPDLAVTGLWFGVFNPVYVDDVAVSDFYAAGSTHFGSNPEWMCHLDWWPDGRYAHSKAQEEIYRLGSQGSADAEHLADYVVTFAHAALTVRRLVERPGAIKALARDPGLAIAVGHDSGDGILLGTLTTTEFERGACDWI